MAEHYKILKKECYTLNQQCMMKITLATHIHSIYEVDTYLDDNCHLAIF